MHLRGWGTKPDKAQAVKLWELAARLIDAKVGCCAVLLLRSQCNHLPPLCSWFGYLLIARAAMACHLSNRAVPIIA